MMEAACVSKYKRNSILLCWYALVSFIWGAGKRWNSNWDNIFNNNYNGDVMELINVYYNNCSILYTILTILSILAFIISVIISIITYNKDKWIKFIISFLCCVAFLYLVVTMLYNKNSITKIYTIDDGNKVEPFIESLEDKVISYNYKDNVLTIIEVNRNE